MTEPKEPNLLARAAERAAPQLLGAVDAQRVQQAARKRAHTLGLTLAYL